jgi:hypothetical protein
MAARGWVRSGSTYVKKPKAKRVRRMPRIWRTDPDLLAEHQRQLGYNLGREQAKYDHIQDIKSKNYPFDAVQEQIVALNIQQYMIALLDSCGLKVKKEDLLPTSLADIVNENGMQVLLERHGKDALAAIRIRDACTYAELHRAETYKVGLMSLKSNMVPPAAGLGGEPQATRQQAAEPNIGPNADGIWIVD